MFFIQFPLKYALKKKFITKIGNYYIPQSLKVPQYYRSKHIIRGEFIGWHIVDSKTYERELVKELTDEQIKIISIWNVE